MTGTEGTGLVERGDHASTPRAPSRHNAIAIGTSCSQSAAGTPYPSLRDQPGNVLTAYCGARPELGVHRVNIDVNRVPGGLPLTARSRLGGAALWPSSTGGRVKHIGVPSAWLGVLRCDRPKPSRPNRLRCRRTEARKKSSNTGIQTRPCRGPRCSTLVAPTTPEPLRVTPSPRNPLVRPVYPADLGPMQFAHHPRPTSYFAASARRLRPLIR
jgi:hypothetical protein